MNRDAFLTRAQAAKVAHVSAAAVGKWHVRGWVDRAGVRRWVQVKRLANGNLLYRLGDILEAERDTRNNPKSRRGSRRVPAQLCAAPPALPVSGGASEVVGDRARPRRSCPPALAAAA